MRLVKSQIPWNKGISGKNCHLYGKKLSEETKKKISKSLTGEKHIFYRKKWKEMYNEEICNHLMDKLKNSNPGFKEGNENWSKKNGAWNKGLTKENSEGVRKIAEAKKGVNNPMFGKFGEVNPFYGREHTEETKQKIRKSLAPKLHLCLDYSKRRPNYLEKRLDNILQENFLGIFKFVGDGSFIIEGRNPDFIDCNGQKLIIELFGEHWHEPEDEEKRKKLFEKYGYKTLVIWGREMKNELKVIEKVRNFREVRPRNEV